MASLFRYTRAVVRGVPSSLPANALRLSNDSDGVSLEKAQALHSAYVNTLKSLGLQVTVIEADENHPDCVFVEDVAVVCDGNALITRIGHASRRGEEKKMREVLENLGLQIHEMAEPACVDGGDVLFTGKEFFVGLSNRTNNDGVSAMAKVFSKYPVTGITVQKHLHLKSMMTMLGEDLIVVGASEPAQTAWREIKTKAKFPYECMVVPEDKAANCLVINGTVVHLTAEEMPKSVELFRKLSCPRIELGNSEFYKVDGCLTCRSILIE